VTDRRQTQRQAPIDIWLATPAAATMLDVSGLSDAEREAWHGIRTERRRLDWASSRALLHAVAPGRKQGTSLSHSHGFSALLKGPPAAHVGVDIERMMQREFLRIAQAAFSSHEAAFLAALPESERMSRFYECWTLKEASAKALGIPLGETLASCCLVDARGRVAPVVASTKPWRAAILVPRSNLRLAIVCVADDASQLHGDLDMKEWPHPGVATWELLLDVTSDRHG